MTQAESEAESEVSGTNIYNGACAWYELPFEAEQYSIVEGDFYTINSNEDGTLTLSVEQNDDTQPRSAQINYIDEQGEEVSYSFTQMTRSSTSSDVLEYGFSRNYGIGFSYDAVSGSKCDFNSVMGQVLNYDKIKEVAEETKNVLYLFGNSSETTISSYSGYSVSEYVHSMCNDSKVSIDLGIYQGDLASKSALWEKVTDKVKFISSEYIISMAEHYIVSSNIEPLLESYPEMLTSSFRAAIKVLEDDPSDTNIDTFLSRYGSHYVAYSRMGAGLTLDMTVSQSSLDSYELDEALSEHAVSLLFKISDFESSEYDFSSVSSSMSATLTGYGGDLSQINSAILDPSFDNSNINSAMFSNWITSIKHNYDDYSENNTEMVDMDVLPIWYLIPDLDLADKVEARFNNTAASLCDLFGSSYFASTKFSTKYDSVTCTVGGVSKTFNSPSVVYIISSGRYVAVLCKEWVPEISTSESVYVAYPICNRYIDLNAGLAIYDGWEYEVAFRYGQFFVTKSKEATQSSTFYLSSGKLSTSEDGLEYQTSKAVIGYDWPGSLNIYGNIDSSTTLYEVKKFMGDFYLNTTSSFANLPNWSYRTTVPSVSIDYAIALSGESPYKLSDISVSGRSGAENLINRMVMDEDYEFFWNSKEVY